MSVRSERPNVNDLAESMATSTIKTDLDANHVNATIAAAQQADSSLAEANSISTNHPEHPLSRSIQVNIRATLGDLCLRKNKATWAPSSEALRNILQQKKFTSLNGSGETSGDLRSVVLHDVTLDACSSDFKVPIGVKVTGVDPGTFSITGESYAHIQAPNSAITHSRLLQQDDVALGARLARAPRPARNTPMADRSHPLPCHSLRVRPQVSWL